MLRTKYFKKGRAGSSKIFSSNVEKLTFPLMRIQHIFLIRFNVTDPKYSNRLTPEWLENRFELFESFCLPSLIGQSNQNFSTYIYFDSKTPATFIARAKRNISS